MSAIVGEGYYEFGQFERIAFPCYYTVRSWGVGGGAASAREVGCPTWVSARLRGRVPRTVVSSPYLTARP